MKLRCPRGGINCVAFGAQTSTVVSLSSLGKEIIVWELGEGEEGTVKHTLRGHTDSVRCISLSPCGRRIFSASTDTTVMEWDMVTGQLIRVLEGHEKGVLSVTCSDDGRFIVSGGWDQKLIVWGADVEVRVRVRTCREIYMHTHMPAYKTHVQSKSFTYDIHTYSHAYTHINMHNRRINKHANTIHTI